MMMMMMMMMRKMMMMMMRKTIVETIQFHCGWVKHLLLDDSLFP